MLRRIAPLGATLLVAGGLLAAAALAAPAVLAGDPCFHSFDNRPPVSSAATDAISIQECTFGPTVAYVPLGAEVTWQNASSQGHEVVGSNLTWGAHDKLLQPGDTIGWTFETAGVYAYSCMLHPGMTGAIVVGDGAAAAAPAGAGSGTTTGQGVASGSTAAASSGPGPAAWVVVGGVGAAAIGLFGIIALAARRNGRPTDDVEPGTL
jgi:plastocyanin